MNDSTISTLRDIRQAFDKSGEPKKAEAIINALDEIDQHLSAVDIAADNAVQDFISRNATFADGCRGSAQLSFGRGRFYDVQTRSFKDGNTMTILILDKCEIEVAAIKVECGGN